MKIKITFNLSECDRRAIWEWINMTPATKNSHRATYKECRDFLESEGKAGAEGCGMDLREIGVS